MLILHIDSICIYVAFQAIMWMVTMNCGQNNINVDIPANGFNIPNENLNYLNKICSKGSLPKKKLRKFGHMSKLGLPYLPGSLVWTKKSLDKYSTFYPTYLSKKFGHFENKVCS